ALKLFGELEEVAMSNLPDGRVREALNGVPYAGFHSLGCYYERFYTQVRQQGYITRSLMYRTVAERISEVDFSSFGKIILAGFYAFTKAEREIVGNLRTRDNVQFIFQEGVGLSHQLERSGMTPGSLVAEKDDSGVPELQFHKAPGTHGQVFALAAKIDDRV